MSFSSEVKKELANVESDLCCQKAELYGIIRYKADIVILRNHFGVQISTTMNLKQKNQLITFFV